MYILTIPTIFITRGGTNEPNPDEALCVLACDSLWGLCSVRPSSSEKETSPIQRLKSGKHEEWQLIGDKTNRSTNYRGKTREQNDKATRALEGRTSSTLAKKTRAIMTLKMQLKYFILYRMCGKNIWKEYKTAALFISKLCILFWGSIAFSQLPSYWSNCSQSLLLLRRNTFDFTGQLS